MVEYFREYSCHLVAVLLKEDVAILNDSCERVAEI